MTLEESTFTWQNNLVRIGFLLGACGVFILFIFCLFAFANYNPERPGDVAVPLILCSVVVFLTTLTGIAIVREQVKNRLPRIKVLHISIALIMVLLFFGLKSFMFGLGIGFIMLMSVFLSEDFDGRLQGVAVCAALICLAIAEASRRAGGYDSEGPARYVINCYSFFSIFLPALLVMSTLRKLPLVTAVACASFALLSLHSASIVCAGMKDVLDDTFGGNGQHEWDSDMYSKFSEQYCVYSTISSPLGFLVSAFQAWKFPPHQFTNTTTTTQFVAFDTVTTTTTFDCSLLGQVDADGNMSNSSNETVYGYDSMAGVDLSHCLVTEFVSAFDPNSTTTTSTSTTDTTTTSTSTTSTTSTSTSSTSTTVTTTTSTTTSSTSTTTATSSTTTTQNFTTVTSTSWYLQSTTIAPFMMTPTGHYCVPGDDIITEVECRRASSALGLVFEKAWNGAGDHKLCAFADDSREKVFFNTASSMSPYAQPTYASVCYRVTPYQEVERCTRSTAEGQEEIRVTSTGYWAMTVFALSGAWTASLTFVIVMVGLARKSARVHPLRRSSGGPGLQLALGDVEGEDAEEARLEEEIYLEKKCRIRCLKKCKLKCRRRWTRCKRRCPCCARLASCCKKCWKKFTAVVPTRVKKICKFLVKTEAAMIGTAVFASSAIGIGIAGATQLPMTSPYCARKPRLAVSLFAWAEEPAQRYAVTWCEYGPIAAVGLGFISFCCFLLAFSMTLVKVQKMYNEERIRRLKIRLKTNRERAAEHGEEMETGTDYGPGFRIQKMVPKEKAPVHVFEDYDGRVFDV